MEEKFKQRIALRRFGNPVEVANLAVYLLSELSAYITGEDVALDGGEQLCNGMFNPLTSMPREQMAAMLQMMRGRDGR